MVKPVALKDQMRDELQGALARFVRTPSKQEIRLGI
jgi:hypothetical protein